MGTSTGSRDQVYEAALRKLHLSQRPNPREQRELRRRRLADGSYPLLPGFVAGVIRRAKAKR